MASVVYLSCLFLISSLITINGQVGPSQSCSAQYQSCYNDTSCWTSVGMNYYNECNIVFGSNISSLPFTSCPNNCKDALEEYMSYFDPDHDYSIKTFCTCDDEDCELIKQYYVDIGCLMNDCSVIFDECANNTQCWNSVGQEYYNQCSIIWESNNTFTSCPNNCENALYNYISYFDPLHNYTINTFCQCGDEECRMVKETLINIDCIEKDCRDYTTECQLNNACVPYFNNYYNACLSIIDHTYNNNNMECPMGCNEALLAYINFISPGSTTPSFCSCNGNEDCEMVKDDLIKYNCIEYSCQQAFENCVMDSSCEPIATNYINNCDIVINGSWNQNTCPNDCENALVSYVNYVYGYNASKSIYEYCDCEGDIYCENSQQNLVTSNCYVSSTTATTTTTMAATTSTNNPQSLAFILTTNMNLLLLIIISIIIIF
jgi:hypothetical protein